MNQGMMCLIVGLLSLPAWSEEAPRPLWKLKRIQNLNFGKLQVGPQGGHVRMSTEGTRQNTGEIRSSGNATVALFHLSGPPNKDFEIQLENPQIPLVSGDHKLLIQDFFCSYPEWRGTLDGSGQAEIRIGATLDTGTDPRPETYQSQDLRLKVQIHGEKPLLEPFSAHAQLISLLCISNDSAMDFGGLLSRGAAGRVKLGSNGTLQSLDPHGPVRATGKSQAARFTLRSLEGTAYCIQLPDQISLQGPGHPMRVDEFALDIPKSGILCKRELSFSVGATLNVPANPIAGKYSGTFQVTVSYY